jgi:hypothetical protein
MLWETQFYAHQIFRLAWKCPKDYPKFISGFLGFLLGYLEIFIISLSYKEVSFI